MISNSKFSVLITYISPNLNNFYSLDVSETQVGENSLLINLAIEGLITIPIIISDPPRSDPTDGQFVQFII